MYNNTYLLNLVQSTLSNQNLSVSYLALTSKRIATMRADLESLWWIEYELHDGDDLQGIANEFAWRFDKKSIDTIGSKFSKLWNDERTINEYDDRCNLISSDSVIPFSVGAIESRRKVNQNQFLSLPRTDNMHPLDVYYTEKENCQARILLNKTTEELDRVLDRIRTRLFDYLVQSESELMRGNGLSNYFEKNRNFVTSYLTKLDNKFSEELEKIDLHLNSNSETDYSECLLDVRRILCHVADLICPATNDPKIGSDGKTHKLTIDRYLNRIEFAIYEKVEKHTSTELITTSLSELCNKLEKLNSLSCKGVHSNVTEQEAYMCVTQLYLLLGELIRILLK